MNLIFNFFQSSLGKKYVMAVTGFALFVFVIIHMLGNLQIFLGPEQINNYAYMLQSKPALVWSARMALLLMVVLHIVAAIKLAQENRAARPHNYGNWHPTAASYASRTMVMSGLIVFVFIVYHLLHFTVQLPAINLTGQNFAEFHDPLKRHDVYRMMVVGYSNPLVSGFYVLGMALLCLHLSHGVSSMFQSLGLKNQVYGRLLDVFAKAAAIIIFIGNVSIPLAVLAGLVPLAK